MVDADGSKRCPRCNKRKIASAEFHRKKAGDGFGGYCKACATTKMTEWQRANPEKIRAWDKARDESNPKRKERSATRLSGLNAWGSLPENAERMRQRNASWHKRHPERSRELSASLRATDRYKAYRKAYSQRPARRLAEAARPQSPHSLPC